MSSCTMYLAVPDVCVAPDTVFGFHGPQSPIYGLALAPAAFEHWSRIMADHYPEPLRGWFLREGRNITVGFYKIPGRRLIDMGIAACT